MVVLAAQNIYFFEKQRITWYNIHKRSMLGENDHAKRHLDFRQGSV